MTETSATRKTAPWRRPYPIPVYLALLVAVIALPMLAFAGVLVVRQSEAQSDVVETFTLATTRAALQSVEREVSGMITTLRVLMASPSFLDAQYPEFHERARLALTGTGTHLLVVDTDFDQILNTRVDFGAPLDPITDVATVSRAFDSVDPQVSPVLFGPTAGEWVFHVARRFPDTEAPQGAVILNAPAASLRSILVGRELPQGWELALVDSGNRVLATSRDGVEIGTSHFLPLPADGASSQGWFDVAVDGTAYRAITQASLLTGWTMVAFAPEASVNASLRDSLVMLVAGGVLLVALAAGGAFLITRRITRSVRGLARDARKVGAGESVEPRIYPVSELGAVSLALSEAAESRRAAEAEAQLLMREVAHRSKNQLSVIGAMAKQTAQGSETVEAFLESFQRRVMGLARSTDLLMTHGVGGIALTELVAAQIEPFRPQTPERVRVEGPRIGLNMHAAQVLGMALHELATNAAKYGAFSGEAGTVEIVWMVAQGTLALNWREHVPDFVAPPEREGFGTVVIRKMVAGTLSAEVERNVTGDGIAWRFVIPLTELSPEAAPAGAD